MQASQCVLSLLKAEQNGLIVIIECSPSNNLPNIVIVGYANKAVDEGRERIRSAFTDSNLSLPRKRTTINLALADVPKDSNGFDLGVAAAILRATRSATYSRVLQLWANWAGQRRTADTRDYRQNLCR